MCGTMGVLVLSFALEQFLGKPSPDDGIVLHQARYYTVWALGNRKKMTHVAHVRCSTTEDPHILYLYW